MNDRKTWLDRLMRPEHWMTDAVRRGLDAFARESSGDGAAPARRGLDADPRDRTAREFEASPSIP